MIKAEIIADSISPAGKRLTTFLLVIPRIVLAEFNTHRAISRNSASSRAIPFEKMVAKVEETPFIPKAFQKDHKGMQGTEYFTDVEELKVLNKEWLEARDAAVKQARKLSTLGVTKQIVNRLLEPFLYHTIIATASDWENFFALRAHNAAEIHIADVAYKMLDCYNKSTPKVLMDWEWHVPFGGKMDDDRVEQVWHTNTHGKSLEQVKVMIATARCARVSYMNYEGKDDYKADIKLHDILSDMGHWSPFEHCAQACPHGVSRRSGNFDGFVQYRKKFSFENKVDDRVEEK